MLHHKLQLDGFILRWFNCNEESHETINTWISNLVSLEPNYVQIALYLTKLENLNFLSQLFNCVTIEALDLWPEIHDGWARLNPTVVNLPYLKILRLSCLELNDEFTQKILSGCPVLEELVIEKCFLNLTDQKISSFSLKKLMIRYNKFSEEARLRIWIPGLLKLELEIQLGQVWLDNSASIEFASVYLDPLSMKNDYDGKEFKLLKGLLNAEEYSTRGFLTCQYLPVLEKLEILDLRGCYINKDLEPLASFLKLTPNLEKLFLRPITMEKELVFGGGRADEIRCEKLKSVEIVCYKGYQGANKLVQYLLTHLQNIENVKIIRVDMDKIQE